MSCLPRKQRLLIYRLRKFVNDRAMVILLLELLEMLKLPPLLPILRLHPIIINLGLGRIAETPSAAARTDCQRYQDSSFVLPERPWWSEL